LETTGLEEPCKCNLDGIEHNRKVCYSKKTPQPKDSKFVKQTCLLHSSIVNAKEFNIPFVPETKLCFSNKALLGLLIIYNYIMRSETSKEVSNMEKEFQKEHSSSTSEECSTLTDRFHDIKVH
jgi:hypothetical protein